MKKYKIGDILKCVEIFDTDKSYISWSKKYKTNIQHSGRIIDEGDEYEIMDFYKKLIYIKQTPTQPVIYGETIPIRINIINKFFKLNIKTERKRKLDKINVSK